MAVLYDVKKVVMTFNDGAVETHSFDTAQNFSYEPRVSEGETKVLRNKNKILGIAETEDIVYGAIIGIGDNSFRPEVIAKIDGGTIIKDVEENITGYRPPKSTAITTRKEFVMDVYCEEKDGEDIIQYVQYNFPRCKGKAFNPSVTSNDFHVQNLQVVAYETDSEPHYKWDYIDQAAYDAL